MGQVQTLPSSGGHIGLTSFAAAAPSNHGGSLPPPLTDVGKLLPIAAKVLMKILYAARLARFDLLRA
eukprot:10676135-Heterocapsa_arctica.AAC.1